MARRSLYISFTMVLVAVFLQACGPKLPNAEEACGHAQNSYGERLSWQSDVPVTLYMHASVPQRFRPIIQKAMDEWTRQAGRQLFRLGGVISQNDRPKEDGVSVIYWMTDWEEDRSFEQGRTFIYYRGNSIYESDMKLNAKDFTFYDGQSTGNSVHLESLVIHELGHVLGLAHIEGEEALSSVMHKYLRKNEERVVLGEPDHHSLQCEYI